MPVVHYANTMRLYVYLMDTATKKTKHLWINKKISQIALICSTLVKLFNKSFEEVYWTVPLNSS